MTYVKRRGMILLVDDSEVAKYTGDGFSVYGKPAKAISEAPPAEQEAGAKNGKGSK